MFDMHNAERAKRGVAPLAIDPDVQAVAKQRARDMARTGEFTHDPQQSPSYDELLDAAGVRRTTWGENIAYNSYPQSQTVSVAMNGLVNSPGHYANIVRSRFTHVGIGIVSNGNRTYFAIVFIGR
jgi:uncharacterized protein YkwD